MLLVPPKALLLVAAFVWLAAGISVCAVGVSAHAGWSAIMGLAFLLIFLLFLVMFIKISNRHIRRIKAYSVELIGIYKFFDPQSYILIVIMIWLGAVIRISGLIPGMIIAPFYSGIGLALLTCAVYYIVSYVACYNESV
jgi:hypothetical protein